MTSNPIQFQVELDSPSGGSRTVMVFAPSVAAAIYKAVRLTADDESVVRAYGIDLTSGTDSGIPCTPATNHTATERF